MRRAGDRSGRKRRATPARGRIGAIEDRPRAWVPGATARVTDRRASRAPVPRRDSVPAAARRHRVRPSDRVEQRCELARVRHRDRRDPGREGVQARVHARADQDPRARDDRSGVVEAAGCHDLEVAAELRGEGVDRGCVVVAIVRVEHVRQQATERDRSSSIRTIAVTVSRYARASTCGFSCQSRPETLRMTSRRSATGSGGAMAKARSLVTASTGRPSAAAAAALTGSRAKTSAERCRERRPSIRPDTDLKGPIVCGAMTTGRPVWAANSWTVDITECRCEP